MQGFLPHTSQILDFLVYRFWSPSHSLKIYKLTCNKKKACTEIGFHEDKRGLKKETGNHLNNTGYFLVNRLRSASADSPMCNICKKVQFIWNKKWFCIKKKTKYRQQRDIFVIWIDISLSILEFLKLKPRSALSTPKKAEILVCDLHKFWSLKADRTFANTNQPLAKVSARLLEH